MEWLSGLPETVKDAILREAAANHPDVADAIRKAANHPIEIPELHQWLDGTQPIDSITLMEYLELAGKVTYANVMRILTSVSEALAYYLAHAPERPAGPPQSEDEIDEECIHALIDCWDRYVLRRKQCLTAASCTELAERFRRYATTIDIPAQRLFRMNHTRDDDDDNDEYEQGTFADLAAMADEARRHLEAAAATATPAPASDSTPPAAAPAPAPPAVGKPPSAADAVETFAGDATTKAPK